MFPNYFNADMSLNLYMFLDFYIIFFFQLHYSFSIHSSIHLHQPPILKNNTNDVTSIKIGVESENLICKF